MGNIWNSVGGGGADLDLVTAMASDVRKDKVIVDKDGNPLSGTMAEIAAKTYTPGTSNQVIAANQFLAGAQTIKGDGNLNANNIVYGKSIFGVAGNVRKYGVVSGTKNSSSLTRAFTVNGGATGYVYYLEVSLPSGFYATAINSAASYADYISASVHWDAVYATSNQSNFTLYLWDGKIGRSGTIYIPCKASGTGYGYRISGYY